MNPLILDGKKLSEKIIGDLKLQVNVMSQKPGLAVVLVGVDFASKLYTDLKVEACQKIGYFSKKIELPATVSSEEILKIINDLNQDKQIQGILIQLPLPGVLKDKEKEIIGAIHKEKDVDGLIENSLFVPCTTKGIISLLRFYKVGIKGKNVVVCGRSIMVGQPTAKLMEKEGGIVTVVHSETKNIFEITRKADILVVAIGQENFIKKDHIKKGAVIIDVGINRLGAKVVGDVDYKDVFDSVSAITPVPGGVGPMTIAMLMENLFEAYQNQRR